jgi:hypothetical protein
MILLVHLLLGALIGQKISNPFLAVVLAFLSHYLLDLIPHTEYGVENIVAKQWKKMLPEIIKVFLDFCLGIMLIILFSNPSAGSGRPIIYACAFFAILPDGISVINIIFKNKFLESYNYFHHDIIHRLKYKKISKFWRIFSQVAVVVTCMILFKI